MNFASDNWAGAHPQIAEALTFNASGYSSAYGTGDLDRRVEQIFCDIFEREVGVFFVGTGTAANSLSLAWAAKPGGVAFCHSEAHAIEDEGGAPEYLTGGTRLKGVAGSLGRMEADALDAAIREYPAEFVHAGQPVAASITQATEIGTLYPLEEIEKIAGICRQADIPLHLDGARFANALVALETTPAEMTWKRGVDIVSFGGTKNGCWCAEAIVVLDPAKIGQMRFLRKRAAQLFSKSRFMAAQFEAYFKDELWLDTARHANAVAADLAAVISATDGARLAWEPQANEVFALLTADKARVLQAAGAQFHPWKAPLSFIGEMKEDELLYRFVTSFATEHSEIERFSQALNG
ncbi:low specificity L-threonine aldolase [uncultured Nitratireductor sp.]|uniref:threonine aldolase family protein n=1 Tax=uncultured Nitratireductor sp. TaxID=520953 RepID=UPI0025FFF3C4|nr:low specificity L-threonine aldolase [uncultured Nitratireductor sp.]